MKTPVCLVTVPALLLLLGACNNYQAGYLDGIEEQKSNYWLELLSGEYAKGYQDGSSERFYNDWFEESRDDMSENTCPVILTELDPLMILGPGYERSESGIYNRIKKLLD